MTAGLYGTMMPVMTLQTTRRSDPEKVGTYSMAEVCERLGIGTTTGYELLARGEFPIQARYFGKRVKFLKADTERFLAGEAV